MHRLLTQSYAAGFRVGSSCFLPRRSFPLQSFQRAHILLRAANTMAESPKTGQVHTLPESEVELPSGKRPKVVIKNRGGKKFKNRRDKRTALPDICSADDVLWRDVITLLGQDVVDKALGNNSEFDSPFTFHQEVELEITSICPSGMCLHMYCLCGAYIPRNASALSFSVGHNNPFAPVAIFPQNKRSPLPLRGSYRPLDRRRASLGSHCPLCITRRKSSRSHIPKCPTPLVR